MLGYKNILYCTDFSEDAEIALVHAVDLAKRYRARLHVLHVLPSLHRYMPTEAYASRPYSEIVEASPEILAKVTEEIKERYAKQVEGVEDVTWTVVCGVAVVEIVRYAHDNDIDLIVMGAKGSSEFPMVKYGSTVENVSRRANCHVMAIRNPEKTFTLSA